MYLLFFTIEIKKIQCIFFFLPMPAFFNVYFSAYSFNVINVQFKMIVETLDKVKMQNFI